MKCGCSGYERLLDLTSIFPEEDAPSEKEVCQGFPRTQPKCKYWQRIQIIPLIDQRHTVYKFVSVHIVVFWVVTPCSLVGSVAEFRRNIILRVCRPCVFATRGHPSHRTSRKTDISLDCL